LTCLWHYRNDSYQLIASTKNEHLSIVVLDSSIASRSIIKKNSSSVLIFASCSWQKNFMFQSQSRENLFSKRSNLIFETIILARQLKVLLDANLHKRRVKSTSREILEIVCRLYFDITSKSVFEKTKDKIRASKELDHSQEQFSFDWVMNLTLITATVKTFLVEIKIFRDYLAENFEFAFSIQSFDLSIDDSVDLITLFISSKHSSAERERKSDEIESLNKDSDSDESREIFATNSVENLDDIGFNSSQTSLHSQSTEIDIFESLTYSNQGNSVKKNRSRSTQTNNQTSIERVHSTIQRSRVQSEKSSFQSSHLRNLRELFITESFLVVTTKQSERRQNVLERILTQRFFDRLSAIQHTIVSRTYSTKFWFSWIDSAQN
jgi:viroplasmin and RNaseH domain-containing protein